MTREEKIEILEKEKAYMLAHGGDRQAEALTSAIKALEQESILDKVRAEVKALSNSNPSYWHSGDMVDRDDVLEILDKYKAESEE